MKNYNIIDYWNERDNPCSNQIDKLTDAHTSYISEQCKDDNNVLDFGPGYGRLFPAYKHDMNIVCVDVTEQYVDELKEAANKNKLNFNFICKTDILAKFEFDDKYFDSVLASEVLFHQTPDIVVKVMKELVRISKKVIVITYVNPKEKYDLLDQPFDKGRYCFNYNYYKIAKKNGWKIYNEKRVKNQLMFVYTERE